MRWRKIGGPMDRLARSGLGGFLQPSFFAEDIKGVWERLGFLNERPSLQTGEDKDRQTLLHLFLLLFLRSRPVLTSFITLTRPSIFFFTRHPPPRTQSRTRQHHRR